jgi:hypothetical protein
MIIRGFRLLHMRTAGSPYFFSAGGDDPSKTAPIKLSASFQNAVLASDVIKTIINAKKPKSIYDDSLRD